VQIAANEPILIAWDVDLPQDQLATLKLLAARLGYFGRAESLALAKVDTRMCQPINAKPLGDDEALGSTQELVRLLLPMSPERYDGWQAANTPAQPAPAAKKAAAKKAATKKSARVPEDIFTALQADTGDLQAAGWNLPPGAIFTNYTRPADAFALLHAELWPVA